MSTVQGISWRVDSYSFGQEILCFYETWRFVTEFTKPSSGPCPELIDASCFSKICLNAVYSYWGLPNGGQKKCI